MNDRGNAPPATEPPQMPMPPTSGVQPVEGEIHLHLFGRTDVGQVREHNEDNFLVADLSRRSRGLMEADRNHAIGPRGTLLGVCDGMGGAAAGEVASQLAVDIIYERMAAAEVPRNRDEFARRLVRAVEDAGQRIFGEAKADRARRGMGTTATVAGLVDDHLFLAQVGDSRGYILRGDKLVQVTRDQSLVNQLIEAGQLTEQEAETFEHNNIILQALGTAETVQVDLTYVHLRQGDTLLLCSDGLSGMVRFEEIRDVLRSVREPLEVCRVLTERANQAGGHDNITVIVARFDGPGLLPPGPDDDLRYTKYPLPEDGTTSALPPSNMADTTRELPSPLGAPGAAQRYESRPPGSERLSDHGPSPSKVAQTMMPGQFDPAALAAIRSSVSGASSSSSNPQASPSRPPGAGAWPGQPASLPGGADLDPIDLPVQTTPGWVVALVVVGALLVAFVAGWYLLR